MKNLLLLLLLLLRRHFERLQLGNDIITKKIVPLGGCYNSHFPSNPSTSFLSYHLFIYVFIWLAGLAISYHHLFISPDQNLDHDSCALSPVFFFHRRVLGGIFSFFSLLHLESTPTGRARERENRISLESMTKREKKNQKKNIQHTHKKRRESQQGCV
jgi:hypothetical protein